MTDDQQRARELFEKWCGKRYNLSMHPDSMGVSVYTDRWVQGAWVGYRAALRAVPEYYDLMNLAATFETCIPFLPATGKKNITKAVAELRAIAGLPHVSSDD